MNLHKNKIILCSVFVVAVVAAGITAITFLPATFLGWGFSPQVEFRVEKGNGISEIADHLSDAGLIRSKLAFKTYAVVFGKDKKLQAGLYRLSKNMSIRNLVNIFSGGLSESEDIVVTIPEGSNINDIDLIFAKSSLTKKGDFLNQGGVENEGYLFPDTYRFEPRTTHAKIIQKMTDNFTDRTKNIGRADKEKIVVMASILEKEVKTKEDMAIVAGIIEKRLSLGMALQIDATVAYGECFKKFLIGVNCEVSEVNLIEGIKKDGPYNTYRRTGLPVGPISNPGLQAINATLNPTSSDYLYYLTDKEGNVYYARTSTEHAQNRAKYLNK